jgi:glyoxylase-like metal-dependent hydrolase (beta-lactamase superfamily II)
MRIACKVVGPLATNCYIVSCEETRAAVIVDPGGDADLITEFIGRTGLEPVEIVSTHGHSDHIAAAAPLQRAYGIGFAIHEADLDIITLSVRDAPLWGMGSIEAPTVHRTLAAGERITVGRSAGTVLHTPGHTPGGISIRFDGMVISGDTLFARSIGRTDLHGGDYETLLASIRRELLTLPDDTTVYTGHGPKTTIGEEKRENPFIHGVF